jgi:sulfur relay (sulfurtransferase) complex TusBCD TusD component (DsrE family)
MNAIKSAVLSLLMLSFVASSALAGDKDPLFVNATSDDAHRAEMALTFAKNQLERQHPVTIFINDKAVNIASKANAAQFKEHQALLSKLVEGGANVFICGMCLKYYGVAESDLVTGVKVGNPDLVGAALFKDDTRTLSW